ncbi:MAG: hypothetical protein KBT03_01035 [Bacteroidales bacterium]|nr:hypothetical protein [Candidatus Scybalousia scybalohippi]
MNLDKFSKGMAKFSIDMKKAYDKDLPRFIGNKAVRTFRNIWCIIIILFMKY